MSVAEQKSFLNKLHKELQRDSEDYRKMTADKRMHTFTVTRRAIRRGIKDRMEKNYPDLPKRTVMLILKKCDKHVKTLIRETGRAVVSLRQKEPDDITIIKFTPSRLEAAFSATGQSRFNQIKRTYNKKYQTTAKGISDVIKEVLGKENESLEASSMWQLEHNYLKGIVESQIKDAIDNALLEEENITKASALAFFQGMGVELDVIRNSSTGVMEVFLGSQRANSKEGGISGAKKKKLQQALLKGLQTLSNGGILENLKGSDSFKQSKIKKTKRKVLKPFKKLKNVTVTSKGTKADDSKTRVGKDIVRTTLIAKNAMKRKAVAATRKRKAKNAAAAQPLHLIVMINKELPDTVRKNMNSPALVNRTGRFAESVKITDIVKTPKGYPSIGYTYQRDPYQVFEEGVGTAPWADGKRDPRALIDKSIREIAAGFAIGRFYTRRV
jgi:hypothetical protein